MLEYGSELPKQCCTCCKYIGAGQIDTILVNTTGSAEQPAFIARREICDLPLFGGHSRCQHHS